MNKEQLLKYFSSNFQRLYSRLAEGIDAEGDEIIYPGAYEFVSIAGIVDEALETTSKNKVYDVLAEYFNGYIDMYEAAIARNRSSRRGGSGLPCYATQDHSNPQHC